MKIGLGISIVGSFALVASLQLSGCAQSAFSEESYGQRGAGFVGGFYGYEDQAIGNDRFQVTYYDVGHDRALSRAQRRAAELCQSTGHRNFSIGNVNVQSQIGIGVTNNIARLIAACGVGFVSTDRQLSAPLASSTSSARLPTGGAISTATGFPGTTNSKIAEAAQSPDKTGTIREIASGEISIDTEEDPETAAVQTKNQVIPTRASCNLQEINAKGMKIIDQYKARIKPSDGAYKSQKIASEGVCEALRYLWPLEEKCDDPDLSYAVAEYERAYSGLKSNIIQISSDNPSCGKL